MRKIYKFHFTNAEDVLSGIEKVQEDLFFEITDEKCADVVINVKKENIKGHKVTFKDNKATICYGKRKASFFRGLMLLREALYNEKTELEAAETPHFETNAVQVDMSRNNPLSIKGLEYFIRHTAIMGLNGFVLYIEDMYELKNYPYFGYMRGRLTSEQMRALDDYAYDLGVELMAQIETLRHLEKYLKYHSTSDIRATPNTLLVGEKATYDFIEDMLIFCKENLRSKYICLGLDEAWDVNTGAYKEKHGDVPMVRVFNEHVKKVYELTKKHGFEASMAPDLYFHMSYEKEPPADSYWIDEHVNFSKELLDGVPKEAIQVFWNYHTEDEDKMIRMIDKCKELGSGEVYWIGAVRSYQSLIIKYTPSIKNAITGMNASKRAGIKKVFLSIWGDCGECPHFVMFPEMLIYAQLDYGDKYDEADIDKKLKFLYDTDFASFKDINLADQIHENEMPELATKFLLYNDPLFGLLDKNIEGMDLKSYYGKLVKLYRDRGANEGPIKQCFDQFKAMLDVLELKADYGLRLKKAYDEKNREELYALADEASIIKKRFEKLMEIERKMYTTYFMSFGLETIEQRRATMCARFDTTRYKIELYLSGEIDSIEELEQERLPYNYNPWENTCENIFFGEGFNRIFSPSL